jgi:uncharacterized iron-regulated membrane protein
MSERAAYYRGVWRGFWLGLLVAILAFTAILFGGLIYL